MIQFEKSSLEKIFSKRKRRKTNESKKNFNRARFVLLRTMFTYGCTACFVSAQNRNRRPADGCTFNAHHVPVFRCQRFDRPNFAVQKTLGTTKYIL